MLYRIHLGLLFLGSLTAGVPAGVWGLLQIDDRSLAGVQVEGIQVPASADPSPAVSAIASEWLAREITIHLGDEVITATREELGVRVDLSEAVARVRNAGHSGEPIHDLSEIIRARRGELNLALPHHMDMEAARSFLEPVVAAPAVVPPGVDLELTLAAYSTRYHTGGRHHSRAHNVETAASKLDGVIIGPHGTLSFNAQVGPRDHASGFRRAMVIEGGELVPGMGGGVCQVASTLHAAALEGGLDMVQYRPHSRPSSYIPMGLDATVSFTQHDLEIANPFDFLVLVQSRAEWGEIHVELIGQARPREVEIARRVLNRRGYAQRVVEDPSLILGTRVVSQRGILGARIERTRTVTEGGETYVEREIVRYPPTDEVVRVGTGPLPGEQLANAEGPIGPLALR